MSTKIYNGYFVAGTVLSAYDGFLQLRKQIQECAESLMASLMASHIAYIYDDAILKGEHIKGCYGAALHSIQDRQKKIHDTRRRDPAVDFEALAICYPAPIVVEGVTGFLVRFLSELPELTDLWQAHPGVRKYGYWNNTEQPEGVTDEEWALRRDQWDSVVDKGPGFIFVFCDYDDQPGPPMSDEVVKNFPSFESRVKNRVHALAVEEKFPGGEVKEGSPFITILDWYESEERKQAVERLTPIVEQALPREIPREVLF